MSVVRRSNRLAIGTPKMMDISPMNTITRCGGVKRRMTRESTPTRSKAAKLDESIITPSQTCFTETPKRTRTRTPAVPQVEEKRFTPVKFDEASPILTPNINPFTTTLSTPQAEPSTAITPPRSSKFVLDTPKTARRRLLADDDDDVPVFFTPSATKSAVTPSALSTVQRIAENGKFAHLSSPVKKSMNYPLPRKYQRFYDLFCSMDLTVAVNKKKSCVFEDVSKNINRKMKKPLTKTELAQILAIYPNSYTVSWMEIRAVGLKTPKKSHEMILEANLKKDLESYWKSPSPQKCPFQPLYGSPTKLLSISSSPRKNLDFIPLSPRKTPVKATPQLRRLELEHFDRLDPWRLACRKAIFRYKLLTPIYARHEEFIQQQGLSSEDLEYGIFHEKFNLETAGPNIEGIELPEKPKDHGIQTKIDDFLTAEVKKNTFVLPSDVEATLNHLKSPEKPSHTPNGKVPLSPKKFAGDTPKLSLYERIMLKQKAKEAQNEPNKIAKRRRIAQLELLRDTLLYSLWSVFTRIKEASSKSVLKLDVVLHRCLKDTTLTGGELKDHIELLCEIAPCYFNIMTVGLHSSKYLRFKATDLNEYQSVQEIIKNEIDKCL